jgi:hypothetical protein
MNWHADGRLEPEVVAKAPTMPSMPNPIGGHHCIWQCQRRVSDYHVDSAKTGKVRWIRAFSGCKLLQLTTCNPRPVIRRREILSKAVQTPRVQVETGHPRLHLYRSMRTLSTDFFYMV